jgi:hypothetical protein
MNFDPSLDSEAEQQTILRNRRTRRQKERNARLWDDDLFDGASIEC